MYKIGQLFICDIINLYKILLPEPSQREFWKKTKYKLFNISFVML